MTGRQRASLLGPSFTSIHLANLLENTTRWETAVIVQQSDKWTPNGMTHQYGEKKEPLMPGLHLCANIIYDIFIHLCVYVCVCGCGHGRGMRNRVADRVWWFPAWPVKAAWASSRILCRTPPGAAHASQTQRLQKERLPPRQSQYLFQSSYTAQVFRWISVGVMFVWPWRSSAHTH